MRMPRSGLAEYLTATSIQRPVAVLVTAAALLAILLSQATRVSNEVGYAAYLGPNDPGVRRLSRFLDEFESGVHILVVFSCVESTLCKRVDEAPALKLLARMQSRLGSLPNVRRTLSLLNAPIVVGPLETRTVAERTPDGRYLFAQDWKELVARAEGERFLINTVIAPDALTAGLVIELQSLDSAAVRDLVHTILDQVPDYEAELGAEIYLAGDPIWSVLSDDDLSADSTNLTALSFLLIVGILAGLFRNVWLTLLPVASVGVLTGAVHGLIGLFAIPMTAILAAVPPVLVVIAITISIHLLMAWVRVLSADTGQGDSKAALVQAARQVGVGCFWAAATTMGGFASFLWSDLASFRHFGLMAALGVGLAFVINFTLLPALLALRQERTSRQRIHHPHLLGDVLGLAFQAVTRRPGFVVVTGLAVLLGLSAGLPRLRYKIHFADQSFILRSARFMEANFRKPMTTDLVVSIPEGTRIYDERTLRLLARLESHLRTEASTGYVWSFLDFLEEAYRLDRGQEVPSFDVLVANTRSTMPIVAAQQRVEAFWSETVVENGNGQVHYRDRARISVDRAWLDDETQEPYVQRLHDFLAALNREIAPEGFQVTLEGALPLSQTTVERVRDTQLSSFFSAFAVVAVTLVLVMRKSGNLMGWAVLLNVLPVVALLGLMGWVGIGVNPANTMVGAILLVIAVDDTIHVSLRYWREREAGRTTHEALQTAFRSVCEAVLVTSVCLALGFSVLMFSRWEGLVSFGLLASVGVIFALLADLLILPAALLWRAKPAGVRG